MNSANKLKILFFDIETSPLKAWIWNLGKQYITHGQLDKNHDLYDIISIQYCFNDGKPAKVLHWGYEEQNSQPILEQFDKIIQEADIIIGKNNKNFDNRHLNLRRMLYRHAPLSDWTSYTDDLQTQFKKHFGKALPSHTLDYISKKLGLGGKDKMEFQDWINIVEKNKDGLRSFKKLLKYGGKDVEDTRAIWEYAEEYLTPIYKKLPVAHTMVCTKCGSNRIHKRGINKSADGSIYQRWYCLNHHGYSQRIKK